MTDRTDAADYWVSSVHVCSVDTLLSFIFKTPVCGFACMFLQLCVTGHYCVLRCPLRAQHLASQNNISQHAALIIGVEQNIHPPIQFPYLEVAV